MHDLEFHLEGPVLKGVVAHVDASGIAVAELALGRRGLKVQRLAHVPADEMPVGGWSGEPEALVRCLVQALNDHGFSRRLDCLGLDDSLTGVTLTDLPASPMTVLSALVGRRVREELPAHNSDMIAHHSWLDGPPADARKSQDGDEALAPAFVAWSERDFVEGLVRAFAAQDLKVRRIMPSSLALLDLLGHVLPREDDRIDVSVHFCWPSIVIGIYGGGRLRYGRFLSNVMADGLHEVVSTGVTELKRTLSFVREKNRGRQPSRVSFSGLNIEDAACFSDRAEAETGIPADLLSLEHQFPASESRQPGDQQVPTDDLVVLAALLHHDRVRGRRRDLPLDLSPPEAPRDRLLLAGMVALLLIGAAVSYRFLQQTESSNLALAATLTTLTEQQQRLARDQPQRTRELALMRQAAVCEGMLEQLALDGINPAEEIMEAVLILPPGVQFNVARLENSYCGQRSLELSLQGDFTGAGSDSLRELQAGLESRPWCESVIVHRSALTLRQERKESVAREDVRLEVLLR